MWQKLFGKNRNQQTQRKTSSPWTRRQPSLERLTDRIAPAANPLAQWSAGTLTVYGTTGNDVIRIGLNSANQIQVFSNQQLLTINGRPASGAALGNTNLIRVYGAAGNDFVNLAMAGRTAWSKASLIVGAAGHDRLYGGTGDDDINGGIGKDIVVGRAGSDTLTGGADNDHVDGGAGVDTINGDGGNDVLLGMAGTDTINGGDGNDSIHGGDDNDTVSGDGGNDTVRGGNGNDTVNGNDGDDALTGDAGDDTMNGGADSDTMQGGSGVDTMNGDAGEDFLYGGDDGDVMNGGDDDDFLAGQAGADTMHGDNGNDVLDGGADNDNLYGDAGDDDLYGGAGDDNTYGGDGNDELIGDDGNDQLNGGEGDDYASGGAGNDTYAFVDDGDASADNDVVADLEGVDALDFSAVTVGVTVDLSNLYDYQAVHANLNLMLAGLFSNVVGGSGDDVLVGNELDNALTGGAGNDSLNGGDANDALNGGDGDDTYVFASELAPGTKTISDSSGTDTLDFSGMTLDLTVDLSNTNEQTVNSDLAFKLILPASLENVYGGYGNDSLTGNELANTLDGGAGDNVLVGKAGDDTYLLDTDEDYGSVTITEEDAEGTDTLAITTTDSVTVNKSVNTLQQLTDYVALTFTNADEVETVTINGVEQ